MTFEGDLRAFTYDTGTTDVLAEGIDCPPALLAAVEAIEETCSAWGLDPLTVRTWVDGANRFTQILSSDPTAQVALRSLDPDAVRLVSAAYIERLRLMPQEQRFAETDDRMERYPGLFDALQAMEEKSAAEGVDPGLADELIVGADILANILISYAEIQTLESMTSS